MFIGWDFLVGFPCAFPLTFLALRADLKRQRIGIVAGGTLLEFAAFFWSWQGFFLWQNMNHGG
ncbi:MAG: hypothetical protein EXR98_21235 [Gemmataceae bacterium]|nr:hypothetical protein [Gemmataceae bacterium]